MSSVLYGCASGSQDRGYRFDSHDTNFFCWSNFFVMDKERTMRTSKARLYGAQPLMRAPKARSYGTCPSLHDRAGTLLVQYTVDANVCHQIVRILKIN